MWRRAGTGTSARAYALAHVPMPTTCGGTQAQGQVLRPMPWHRVEEPGDTATELSSEESFVNMGDEVDWES